VCFESSIPSGDAKFDPRTSVAVCGPLLSRLISKRVERNPDGDVECRRRLATRGYVQHEGKFAAPEQRVSVRTTQPGPGWTAEQDGA
jgi:hypothetical protein